MKDDFIRMNLKQNIENINTSSEYRYFLESNFVGVNRLLFQFIQIKMTMLKDLKVERITYQKV